MLRGRDNCNAADNEMRRQIEEDTCDAHRVFCCPVCFDQGVDTDDPHFFEHGRLV